jgi:serine/threonine protein kinase
VQILDFGEIDGQYFIAMEFVDGPDLYQVLHALHQTGRQLSTQAVCFIISEICHGLHYAHCQVDPVSGTPLGIIHRDVSPQNILLSWAGAVKIADFGIAKAAHRLTETEAGVIKGKFYYMSPEQACGEPIDHRSDVFSAGILLFESLTANPLYEDPDEGSLLKRVKAGAVRSPRAVRADIPEELEAIAIKALSLSPGDRYESALAMARDLTQFVVNLGQAYTRVELSSDLYELFSSLPAEQVELTVDTDPVGEHLELFQRETAVYADRLRHIQEPSVLNNDQCVNEIDTRVGAVKTTRSSGPPPLPPAAVTNIFEKSVPEVVTATPCVPEEKTAVLSVGNLEVNLTMQPRKLLSDTELQTDPDGVPKPKPSVEKLAPYVRRPSNDRLARVRQLTPLPDFGSPGEVVRCDRLLRTALRLVVAAIVAVSIAIGYVLVTWSETTESPVTSKSGVGEQTTDSGMDRPSSLSIADPKL